MSWVFKGLNLGLIHSPQKKHLGDIKSGFPFEFPKDYGRFMMVFNSVLPALMSLVLLESHSPVDDH